MLDFTSGARRILSLASATLSVVIGLSMAANAEPASGAKTEKVTLDPAIKAAILAGGVPAEALEKLLNFRSENLGKKFQQETYTCIGKPESLRPCEEEKRQRTSREISIIDHPYLVIIDFRESSLVERMFIIHLPTGQVTRMQVTHGKNTGNLYAHKFSNIKDSKQTSLGIYMLGEPYVGGYGSTLRMYGLQGSNDQAYNRDIVMHGAPYAAGEFPHSENYKTKKPYGRLGVSWGCPAIALKNAKKWFPLLKDGALVYHYQPELEDAAQTGREVMGIDKEITLPAE